MNIAMLLLPIALAPSLLAQAESEAPARLEPLKFGWKIPAEAVVTDYAEKDGNTSKMRYVLRAVPDKEDSEIIRVQMRDFEFLEFNGVDATTPEMKKRLASTLALTSAIPDMLVDSEGTYLECENMDSLTSRVAKLVGAARNVNDEEVRQVTQMMSQPQFRETMQAAIGQYWASWTGAYIGWDLPPGQSEESEIEVAAFGALIPMKQSMRNLGAVRGRPDLTRLRIETLGEGPKMVAAMMDMLENMDGVRPPEDAIRSVKSENSVYAEIDPRTLRPHRVITEKNITVRASDVPEGKGRVERHDYRFEWKTPRPADKGK